MATPKTLLIATLIIGFLGGSIARNIEKRLAKVYYKTSLTGQCYHFHLALAASITNEELGIVYLSQTLATITETEPISGQCNYTIYYALDARK